MAKLTARGHKVQAMWSKVTHETDDQRVTRWYAWRSDGKLLTRTSRRYHNVFTKTWETDSGHWAISTATSKPLDEINAQLLRNGYTRAEVRQ